MEPEQESPHRLTKCSTCPKCSHKYNVYFTTNPRGRKPIIDPSLPKREKEKIYRQRYKANKRSMSSEDEVVSSE